MKKVQTLLTFLMLNFVLQAQNKAGVSPELVNSVDKQFFIENKGQWHSDVLYLCRMGGLDAWITKYGVNYTFFKLEEIPSSEIIEHHLPDKFEHKDYNIIGHRVLMKLENHNAAPAREGKQKQEGYYNYFIGNDDSKHATYVGLYKEAIVKEIYNGIDLRYYFDKGHLRYDYIVHPGADPSQIVFALEGSDKTYINDKGNVVFTTRFGEVAMAELKTYQGKDKKEINSRFVEKDGKWKIAIGNYDRTQTLIIDPLVYSTYIGGNSNDFGRSIAVDGSGQAYVTGFTESPDYDITAGAFQTTNGGSRDVFVTLLNTAGTALVYSTFIGGNNNDEGRGITVDASGNAYVTGKTASTDYDITAGAFQTTNGGVDDVFVTRLNATGTALLYSTYIGGSGSDSGFDIAVDGSGQAYVTGQTYSTNYDITSGAFQTTYGGNADVFVTRLNATGTALVYSTFLGGSSLDLGRGIALDGNGQAYVTGTTQSTNYDITPGAFQTTLSASFQYDVFVTRLNATGTALVYSTYIGGTSNDYGNGIALDTNGQAYVTGETSSPDYDITSGAFQTTFGGNADVFVTRLNTTGTALVYSTYIGGSDYDYGYGIALGGGGQAHVTGHTQSLDFDITAGAYQTTNGGNWDVFVTRLNATGTALVYSTYIGGNGPDEGFDIAMDGGGNAYVIGQTSSTNYDITTGAFQTTPGGGFDAFVTRLNLSATSITENIYNNADFWSLYPNPSQGTITIQTKQGGVFELLDVAGRTLSTHTVINDIETIKLNLSAGMYFIREKESGATQKLIIE